MTDKKTCETCKNEFDCKECEKEAFKRLSALGEAKCSGYEPKTMPDKLTDTEVKKALKAEAVKEFAERLKEKSWDVPYETKGAHYVQVVDIGDIEDIEKEMVGNLTMNKLNYTDICKRQEAQIEHLETEINRLKGILNDYELEFRTVRSKKKIMDKEKAKALKDFVKRLKEKGYIPKPYGSGKVVDEYDIDNLLKETVSATQ